jgi:hypothetical protein
MEWNGDKELLAATQDGVFRCDLQLPNAISLVAL